MPLYQRPRLGRMNGLSGASAPVRWLRLRSPCRLLTPISSRVLLFTPRIPPNPAGALPYRSGICSLRILETAPTVHAETTIWASFPPFHREFRASRERSTNTLEKAAPPRKCRDRLGGTPPSEPHSRRTRKTSTPWAGLRRLSFRYAEIRLEGRVKSGLQAERNLRSVNTSVDPATP